MADAVDSASARPREDLLIAHLAGHLGEAPRRGTFFPTPGSTKRTSAACGSVPQHRGGWRRRLARDNDRRVDVVVAYITSVPCAKPDATPIAPTPETGLKVPSLVRFDKLATIDKGIIVGRLGDADPAWLEAHDATFFTVFGFRHR